MKDSLLILSPCPAPAGRVADTRGRKRIILLRYSIRYVCQVGKSGGYYRERGDMQKVLWILSDIQAAQACSILSRCIILCPWKIPGPADNKNGRLLLSGV
jgi:hypothetical protein